MEEVITTRLTFGNLRTAFRMLVVPLIAGSIMSFFGSDVWGRVSVHITRAERHVVPGDQLEMLHE